MALSWEIGRVMDEEQRDYVHTCLTQLDWFRRFVKRTGLVEEADRVGWMMGDAVYTGFSPIDALSDHADRVVAILGLPLEEVWVDDGYSVTEGVMRSPFGDRLAGSPERLVGPDGAEIAAGEEDILFTLKGGQEDLDAIAELWPLLAPRTLWGVGRMFFCRREYRGPDEAEDEAPTLAERFAAQEPMEPHVCVLTTEAFMEQEAVYDTFFEVLIRTWEVMRDAEDAGRKAGRPVGDRRRIGRIREGLLEREAARKADRALPGAGEAAEA